MIKKEHPKLSIKRQCEILSIHRSGLYYQSKKTSKLNRELMRLIDEQYLNKPYYGVYRMWEWLSKDKGYKVNIKRIRRLYRLMAIEGLSGQNRTFRIRRHAIRCIHTCSGIWS